jgi:phage baseplate assembly protein W
MGENLPAAACEEMSGTLLVGWPLTQPDAGGFFAYASGAESLHQSLWNILMTTPGERLMRPAFGAGLNQWVGQPNTETMRTLIASSITTAIGKWEQRVAVSNVSVAADSTDGSRVIITIAYAIRGAAGAPPESLSLALSLGGA